MIFQKAFHQIRKYIFLSTRFILNRKPDIMRLSDEEFIEYCYNSLLNRPADNVGKQNYQKALSLGLWRLEVVEHIINSEEFKFLKSKYDDSKKFSEFVPQGHYYSVIPSDEVIEQHQSFNWMPDKVLGVDLREAEQWTMIHELKQYYAEHPYQKSSRKRSMRYIEDNGSFALSDALILYSMIRHAKPKRIIEIGSGWSSGVIIDTNELFFDNQIELTFIEPYPDTLHSVMNPEKDANLPVIAEQVQNVSSALFQELEANDIVFIDSSHVSKVGSDVNHLIFNVLPILKSGVLIHIHDIFYPFEFPYDWLTMGRFWNEQYLVKAFLQYNTSFEIVLFSSMMIRKHKQWFEENMPDWLKTGGCIWLRKNGSG